MRDAIFYGYDWVGLSSTERMALAIARSGGKVLHCGTALSWLHRPDRRIRQVEERLFTFTPVILGSRFNHFPGMERFQAAAIVRQILRHARELGLKNPMFVYSGEGLFLLPTCEAMKARGFFLAHVCMDFWESGGKEHVELPDVTLVIPEVLYERLHSRWGSKIRQIPQAVDLRPYRAVSARPVQDLPIFDGIPRPRLGYAGGGAQNRLDMRLLADLLKRRPEWSFVSFGNRPVLPLPNAYVLPWQSPQDVAQCVAGFDVGFMPYPCSEAVSFHCVPLKLFDYFALGIPAVATPILHLREPEFEGLIYLGETAEDLERAVEAALAEPQDSPKRQRRKEIAEAHSMEAFGRLLEEIFA